MSDDGQVKVVITGESSSLVDASGQGKEAIRDLSQSLPEGSELFKKYKNIIGESGEQMGGFNMHSRETRIIASELNRIIPGLGLAFRGLTMAMLPFAAIALAIQAASLYLKRHKDAVEAAATSHAEALDKMRTATHNALIENDKYNESLRDTKSASDEIKESLADATTILNAQIKARSDLLKVDEEAEMLKAKTPEEKEAVKKKYEGLADEGDAEARAQRLNLDRHARDDAQGKEDQAKKERVLLEESLTDANIVYTAAQKEAVTVEMEAKRKEIEVLQKTVAELDRKVNVATSVGNIESAETFSKQNRPIWNAAGNMDEARHGVQLSSEQAETNRLLTEAFAHQRNGIAALQAIIKYHIEHSTSQAEVTKVLANALKNLATEPQ
jgi:hypothetical protein